MELLPLFASADVDMELACGGGVGTAIGFENVNVAGCGSDDVAPFDDDDVDVVDFSAAPVAPNEELDVAVD